MFNVNKQPTALLITYYWPPAGGAGVHRWLRFSRYFKENGWDLHVYCPKDAAWPVLDEDLENEVPKNVTVVRHAIFEPHKYLGKKNNPNKAAGLTTTKKSSPLQKAIIWVRGNLFIPDARVFWIKPSIRFLRKYLKEHPEITTVISTGPPHSTHLIARQLKKEFNIKWVADFRDPWTSIDFYQDLLPGKRADAKHKALELSVLKEADKVVTVSSACAEELGEIANRKIKVITNGFIFPTFDPQTVPLDKSFTISHFGSMPQARNPEILWKVLKELCEKRKDFKDHLIIRLVGAVDFKVIDDIKKHQLSENLELIDHVQHKKSIFMQRSSQLLLLVANKTGNVKGILTGKFFEYLGAKRPIIAFGASESDLEKIMHETDAGFFSASDDQQNLLNYLEETFDKFSTHSNYHQARNIEQFSSSVLLKKYLDFIID